MNIELGYVDALGFLAAGIVFLTFCMRTMLALRLTAIASNLAFIAYAVFAGLAPILLLHGALLPLNLYRLFEMRRETRATLPARLQPPGSESYDWLAALGRRRQLPGGATLFAKGDRAESMFVVVEGRVAVPEVDSVFGPGALIGEIGLFSAERTRTASAVAVEPTVVAELSERRVKQLYFDNPEFAYRLVRLITKRLVSNVERIERQNGPPPPAGAVGG